MSDRSALDLYFEEPLASDEAFGPYLRGALNATPLALVPPVRRALADVDPRHDFWYGTGNLTMFAVEAYLLVSNLVSRL